MAIEKRGAFRKFKNGNNTSFKLIDALDLNAVYEGEGSQRFVLKDCFPYSYYTVQINILNADYGEGTPGSGSFKIQDSEDNEIFVDIPDQILTVDAGDSVLKFRIVDLKTAYFSIFLESGDLSQGTVQIFITPGGHY